MIRRQPTPESGGPPECARRVLICVPGTWTDAWFDAPDAWWQWCCAFLGWDSVAWHAFYARWRAASGAERETLMDRAGLRFFDWRRVPGGSIRGSTRAAAALLAQDLARLPFDADVTLVGHSKGGNAVKHLLAATPHWPGARPRRAIFIDAPLDWLRESAGRLLGLGFDPCRFAPESCGIPLATINNWLDPSGGRLRRARNYQTFVWQDYLVPYPPHGLKGFLAERVLRDTGALPPLA